MVLAGIRDDAIKLPLRFAKLRFDFDSNGNPERSLVELFLDLRQERTFPFLERNPDFLVCFEARATPVAAEDWLSKLRQHTDKPIRYLVLSHYHAVRVLGASAFGAGSRARARNPAVLAFAQRRRAARLSESRGRLACRAFANR